jgi:acyl transferase domain-containing protein/NAD(P)-dependent dehydrogenase (short-subunit alcohol dehydrogenase family)
LTRQRYENNGTGNDHRPANSRSEVPIAIVGMACLFPQAQSPQAFWSNVLEGRDCIREVPMTHWLASDFFDADPKSPDMTYSRQGAFLDSVDFAPLEFGIAPKNLEAIDTTQLLGLVVSRDALADSGYATGGKPFDRHRASVILGVTGTLEMVIPLGARLGHPIWRKSLADCGVDPETAEKVVDRIGEHYVSWQENSFPGLLGNVTAGRIANRLDLGGTNCVVDAACASSLGAVHLAVMELAAGRSDLVISGGFDTFNDIFMFMCFSKTPALSKSGHARPFDKSADGTSLGEGLGAVVLKRLDDAERDGDRIYAVIRGVGSSSDGIGQAVYAPKAEGQVRCLETAYQVAGVDPATVELVEAHGTGTKVGDGIEVKALTEVFGRSADASTEPWCAVGSVKSQIGHTKAAAGVAGLIKAALALHHKVIPPTIKVTDPAEEFAAPNSPFYVTAEPRPWPSRPEHPRRAGVSAFGFGGSNFHAVLEEHGSRTDEIGWSEDVDLLTLHAERPADLKRAIEAIPETASWKDLQRAAAEGRYASASAPESSWRLAVVLRSKRAWPEQRKSILAGLDAAMAGHGRPLGAQQGWYLGNGPVGGKLAVVFAGQGSQSLGMLRDAACRFPVVARTMEESDLAANRPSGYLVSKIYPVDVWSEQSRLRAAAELTRTEIAQPALASLGLGAARLLGEFGVSPHCVGGHSLGELTALAAVGRIAPRNVHELVEIRGQAMARAAVAAERRFGSGGMTAVLAPDSQWADLLQTTEFQGRVFVANRNAPAQTVLAGSSAALEHFEKTLSARNVRTKRLQVASAFHSPWVEEASSEMIRALAGVAWQRGSRPVYGNTYAAVYPDDPSAASRVLAEQLARPVDFVGMIRRMEADGHRTFLDIGPDNRLATLIRSSLAESDRCDVLSFAESNASEPAKAIVDLARVLGSLWSAGHAVKLDRWMTEASAIRRAPVKKVLTIPMTGANLKPAIRELPKVAEISKPRPSVPEQSEQTAHVPASLGRAPLAQKLESSTINGSIAPDRAANTETSSKIRPSSAQIPHPQSLIAVAPSKKDSFRMTPKEHPPVSDHVVGASLSRSETLIALQRLMEQTASVHAQFLATQRHAQETVRMILTGHPESSVTQSSMIAERPAVAPSFVESMVRVHEEPAAPASAFASHPEAPFGDRPAPAVLAPIPAASTTYQARSAVTTAPKVEARFSVPEAPAQWAPPAAPAVPVPVVASAPVAVESAVGGSAALLLEIVSEKTGYPLEMLELDQQLDADLGIDSIKRVEILSAIQERRSDLPHVRTDQFGALRTLRDVVALLDAAGAAPAAVPAPAAVSAPAAEPSRSAPAVDDRFESFAQLLREIVSEKTGYPVEMLELDLQLDTDLGIDSIKRVEILSAIQERMPNLPHIRTDQFGALMTLRDIVMALTEIGPNPPNGPTGGGPGSGSSSSTHAGRPEPRQVQTSNVRTSRLAVGLLQDGERSEYVPSAGDEIWIVDDRSDLVKSLVESLNARGARVALIDPETIDRIEPPERLTGLVLTTPETYDHAAFGRVLRLVAKVSRPIQEKAKSGFAFVAGLMRLDGKFGLDAEVDSEELSGWPSASMSGLTKTLAWEWPQVASRVFDVDRRWAEWQPKAAAETLAAELFRDGPAERGLGDPEAGAIVTPILEPIPREGAADIARLRDTMKPGDLVVVTGGARGVTAEVAAAVAEAVRPTLLVLGRSAEPAPESPEFAGLASEAELIARIAKSGGAGRKPSEFVAEARRILADREVRGNLERFRSLASQVIYRAVDLRDTAAVADAVASAVRVHGPVRGIVHGAGVLADKRVEDLSPEACMPVLETKIRGLLNLVESVDPQALRFVVAFSSITARVGRTGQAAYAAANEMLNKLTIHLARQYPECRWLSLGWGPWDGGMVTPALKKVFASEGVGLIPLESGSWTLLELLGSERKRPDAVEWLVLEGDGRPTIPCVSIPKDRAAAAQVSGVTAAPDARGEEIRVVWDRPAVDDEWPALRHHVIDGAPVVPTALLTEWMIEGAMHVIPGMELAEVRDMSVLKGIVLRADGPKSLRVVVRKIDYRPGGLVIASMAVQGAYGAGARVLDQARAEVVLGPIPDIQEPDANVRTDSEPRQTADPYRDLLFHGPMFQGLAGPIRFDDKSFVGRLANGSRPTEWLRSPLRSQWVVDPLVLDVVMQGICCWPKLTGLSFSLPMGFRRMVWRSVPPEAFQGGRVELRLHRQNDHEILADAVIFDGNGQTIGRVERIRGVMDERLEAAFRRNALSRSEGR